MIIYRDVIGGDEMFSDVYTFREVGNGIMYEVDGKNVIRREGFDESSIGANPSAEELSEVSETSTTSGVDIILNHKLVETGFEKKDFVEYTKIYMKALKDRLEASGSDRLEAYVAHAGAEFKKIVKNFKNYQFYIGENMHPAGMVALLDYREDGVTPFMLFFKDGLEAEKC